MSTSPAPLSKLEPPWYAAPSLYLYAVDLIAASISPQSRPIERDELERLYREAEERFDGAEVPRPANWGGYVLDPETVEFWQGRENRLHDRLRYVRGGDGGWSVERLAP